MEKNKINLLINMFHHDGDTVFILDANWNIIEGEYTTSFPERLPKMLHVSENCWENTKNEIYFNKDFYKYELYCSKKNQCRVLVLKKHVSTSEEANEHAAEDAAVNTAVQSLKQLTQRSEITPELSKSIERISLLLSRKPYLRGMIKSIRNDTIFQTPFFLQDALQQLKTQMSELLAGYAEITLDISETKNSFYENQDFFNTMLLAGIVLCHHERGCFHHIQISLSVYENTAYISIILKPDFSKRIDMSLQLENFSFGTHTEEKELLNLFCMMHQGEWSVSPPKMTPSLFQLMFRIEFQNITVHSTQKKHISRFGNTSKLMLAPVYLSSLD